MTIKVTLKDGKGSNRELCVDKEGSALVTETKIPPKELGVTLRPFALYLTDDGTTTGSKDMRVNGSTNYVDFYIQASNQGDRYIQTLAFTIADAGAQLNEFGNLVALTNGCQLFYEDASLGDVTLASELKTNFDFVQLCNFEPTFGTGAQAFLAQNVIGTSEAYIPLLDITDVFGLPYGLRLPKDSLKRIVLRVNDDITTIDRFDVRAFGFDRIDNEDN